MGRFSRCSLDDMLVIPTSVSILIFFSSSVTSQASQLSTLSLNNELNRRRKTVFRPCSARSHCVQLPVQRPSSPVVRLYSNGNDYLGFSCLGIYRYDSGAETRQTEVPFLVLKSSRWETVDDATRLEAWRNDCRQERRIEVDSVKITSLV